MISVLILTYDEEVNIRQCIASLPWRDDIHVLDSGSRDSTVSVAIDCGAKVTTRPFDSYSRQRNAGLSLPFKYEWVVMLDADERMTPRLANEIEATVHASSIDTVMFRVLRRDFFMGRWLRRSSGYPSWFPRVFRRGRVRVERDVNELYIADGRVEHLAGHIDHYPFAKGIEWWFDRHNRYSTAEVSSLLRDYQADGVQWTGFLSRDALLRRRAHKLLAYRLPGRPVLAFLYLYVFRGGFLDGKPGLLFALMRMSYEIMIDVKTNQLRMDERLDV